MSSFLSASLQHAPILAVLIPLLAAPLAMLFGRTSLAFAISLIASALSLALSLYLASQVLDGSVLSYHIGGWAPPAGIEYRIDAANALVLVLVSLIATVVLPFARTSIHGEIAEKHHTLFLGRGPMWPIAMEGALKLKEISYIHAEAYAAGELKHGPLALIDEDMPVIVVAPNNELLDKLKSNVQVVRARGGQLYVFADKNAGMEDEPGIKVIPMPHADRLIAPIVYTIPLQLLSYHVALLKGTDVDQPRNLAKSVTVE